jgi:hypothetical protein
LILLNDAKKDKKQAINLLSFKANGLREDKREKASFIGSRSSMMPLIK